jgi:phage baseplate assembly protein W
VAEKPHTYRVLGTDLAVTRYTGTTSAVPLEAADSWSTIDLRVARGGRGGLKQKADPVDLATVSGRDDLAQALTLRLLTPQGALAPLGHPEYGSRLVELIGRNNTDTTRNLARLYTIQAIQQERRVRQLRDLGVETVPGQPFTIRIGFSVVPMNDDEPLALALELTL